MVRHGKLVLIVDRDLDFVEDLRTLLRDHRTLSARSLTEAIEIAVGGRVDVVVLGPSFGSESGVRSAAEILETDPDIAVVLVANIVTNRVLRAALQLGFVDVVDTPVTLRKLSDALDRAVERDDRAPAEPDVLVETRSEIRPASAPAVEEGPVTGPPTSAPAVQQRPDAIPVAPVASPTPSPAQAAAFEGVELVFGGASATSSGVLEFASPTEPASAPVELAFDAPIVEPPIVQVPRVDHEPVVINETLDTTWYDAPAPTDSFVVEPSPMVADPVAPVPAVPAVVEPTPFQPGPDPAQPPAAQPPPAWSAQASAAAVPPAAAPPAVPAVAPASAPPTAPVPAPAVPPDHAPAFTPDPLAPVPVPPSMPPPTAADETPSMPLPTVADPIPNIPAAIVDRGPGVQVTRPEVRNLTGKGRVITVTAGKAGSGKTVAATNLAAALSERLGPDRVVIVDVDLQFGDVALLLQLEPSRTIIDAVEAIDGLTDARLDAMLLRHDSGLRVLPAPLLPLPPESTSIHAIVAVIERLKRMYDVVVVDTPPIFGPTLLSILDHSDTVLMIVDMDLPSVKNAKIAIDSLRNDGYPVDRVNLVVNRVNSKARLDLVELERSLGLRVSGSIPSDRVIPQSVNEGVPVVLLSPRSRVAKSFHSLAERFGPESARRAS